MITNRTTRFAAVMLAVVMTIAINGTLLWKFDALAQEGVIASSGQPAVVVLETVNIVAPKS